MLYNRNQSFDADEQLPLANFELPFLVERKTNQFIPWASLA